MRRFGPIVFFFVLLQTSSFANTLVFTSYGPGDTYDTTLGYTLGQGYSEGNLFQPSMTGMLAEIDLALSHYIGSTVVNMQLMTDNNNMPGTVIESFTLNPTTAFGTQGVAVPAISVLHPILDAQKTYWLILSSDSASANAWYNNSQGMVGPRYCSGPVPCFMNTNALVMPYTMAAFDVVDSQILAPEPSTFLLMAGALLGGLAVRLRRR
jgi:hypothetical protein